MINERIRQDQIKSICVRAKKHFEEKFKKTEEGFAEKVVADFVGKYHVLLSAETKQTLIHQDDLDAVNKMQDYVENVKQFLNLPNTVLGFLYSGDCFRMVEDLLLKNAVAIKFGQWNVPKEIEWKKTLNDIFKKFTDANKPQPEWWCLARLCLGFEEAREELKQIAVQKLTTRQSVRQEWNDLLENAKDEDGNRLFSDMDITKFFSDVYATQGDRAAAINACRREWRLGRY